MKKIIQYILLASLVCSPLVSYALFSVTPTETNTQTTTTTTTNTTTNTNTTTQPTTTTNQTTTTTTTSGTSCTGDLRTDLADAQACANLAEQQGSALGYTIDCKVEQLGLGGFTDPTSGKDYILNTVCSVNGSPYQYGAYNLAGFTAESGSNAIVTNVNSGWSILQTELKYQNAYNQCGGSVYYVNGGYSCTAPAGTPVATAPGTSITPSTPSTSSVDPVMRGTTILLNTLRSVYERLIEQYKSVYGIHITGTTTTNPNTSASTGRCFVFTRNLSYGDTGADVRALTYALKQENLLSDMTSDFDANVMTAVKRFQEAHATDILSILGLTQGTGVVGPKTREYLNAQCSTPSYIVANPVSPAVSNPTPTPSPTTSSNTCIATASVSDQKTGVYKYTFTKNTDGTYKVQLNNPAYGTVGDRYYVAPNFSFNAPNALDLNRQNQGWFNYLSSLPGTAEGNTFYQNMFGSFNNAYYDWNNMVTQLNAKIANCSTTTGGTITSPTSISGTRFVKVSVKDWDTLPLALREIRVYGASNSILKIQSLTATDFGGLAYTPANLMDSNDNSIWQATKTASMCPSTGCTESQADLQVIILDMGQVVDVQKVGVTNYGLTDTRVFVIEVSKDGNNYTQIAEVRAQVNAPIADKGLVWGIVSAASTVGPIQY